MCWYHRRWLRGWYGPTQEPPPYHYPPYPYWCPPPPPEVELEALEAYKKDLEEELKGVEARINDLKRQLGKG